MPRDSRDDRVGDGAAGRAAIMCAGPWLGLLAAVALTACGGGGGGSGSSAGDEASLSVESISIEPGNVELARGADTEVRVVATLSNGEQELISDSSDAEIDWEALDSNIAGVTDTGVTGVVHGNRIGNATIRAHLNDNTAWADVVVSALQVLPSQINLAPGCPARLTARLVAPDGSTQDVTTDGSLGWTSTDGGVATVAQTGRVEALGPGKTVVRANRGEARAAGRVTVAALKDPGGLELVDVVADAPPDDPLELSKGQTRRLRAVGVFDDAGLPERDITDCVSWTSDDDSVVGVSADGRVTAVGDPLDAATVTATYNDGMSTTLAQDVNILIDGNTFTLAVSGPGVAPVQLEQGATANLTATASFVSQPDEDVTDAVDWSSSDESVATVSDDSETAGRVTAVAPGSGRIEASMGGETGSIGIEVIATPAEPAALTASAEPNVVLAGADDPSTVCARLVPNGEDQVVTQHDIEFSIAAGPASASLASGSATGDTVIQQTGNNGEPACVVLEPGSDAGTVTVRALEPDSGLDEVVDIEIVTSFSEVFSTSVSSIVPAIQGGSAQAGTVFEVAFANGSNRAFTTGTDQITFCNGNGVITVQPKIPAVGNRVGDGGELEIAVELSTSEPDNGFATAVGVFDEDVIGSAFTLVHHFTDPEAVCPP